VRSPRRYRFLAAGFLAVPLAGAFFIGPQAIDASSNGRSGDKPPRCSAG